MEPMSSLWKTSGTNKKEGNKKENRLFTTYQTYQVIYGCHIEENKYLHLNTSAAFKQCLTVNTFIQQQGRQRNVYQNPSTRAQDEHVT